MDCGVGLKVFKFQRGSLLNKNLPQFGVLGTKFGPQYFYGELLNKIQKNNGLNIF
jgi:hypothetical protein